MLALSPSQTINVFTQSGGHLIVDVYGYYVPSGATSAGRFTSLAPQRILDTRTGNGAPVGRVNGQLDLQVTGRGGVPGSGVAAVAMVLTGTDALGPGFATAWPTGQPLPNASTLNLSSPNETRANLVVVPVGANGKVSLRTSMGVHLIADVAGWITDASQPSSASGLFVPITPTRLLDTRQTGQVLPVMPRAVTCTVGMRWALPVGTGAVAANLTAVSAPGFAFLTAFPGGGALPNSSNLNTSRPGDVVAGQSITRLGPNATVAYQASAPFHLIIDVTGWFTL